MPAPLASALPEEDVAPVGVDVHLVGIEREEPERAHGAASRRTTAEPTWIFGLGDLAAPGRSQAGLLGLGLERAGVEDSEADLRALVGQVAVGGHDLAEAGEHDPSVLRAKLDRKARIDPAVDLGDVGQRRAEDGS